MCIFKHLFITFISILVFIISIWQFRKEKNKIRKIGFLLFAIVITINFLFIPYLLNFCEHKAQNTKENQIISKIEGSFIEQQKENNFIFKRFDNEQKNFMYK
jgi:uncharacterized membrane protein SirB2